MGTPTKTCPCGAEFPREYNSRGQATTRRLCDACRGLNADQRNLRDRAAVPPDTPRCRECGALVGLAFGGVSHLDEAGRCPPCAAWQSRRAQHERMVRAGDQRRAGMWVRGWSPPAWPRRKSG